ncbi:MAG: FAD-dependent oxidoreductase [Phycisphaerae bacterium]
MKYSFTDEIPVVAQADVVVVGGGPGGIGAAVMAARNGARVILVERYGYPGGMAGSGEVHPFMRNQLEGECLDKPVYLEWVAAIQKYNQNNPTPGEEGVLKGGRATMISKEAAMLAAEDLLLDAGVDVIYHHDLVDAIVEDGKIDAAVFHSKSGFVAIKGKAFVDCTGDGDLAAVSGCEFEIGGPTGHCQPMTTCFKLANIDPDRMPSRQKITELYWKARDNGEISCPREDVLMFDWLEPTVMHFNTTRIIHRSAVDGIEISQAEIEGRKQIREFLAFFHKHVPGFENARIHSMAHHVGVRESRRVKGIAYGTREDFVNGRKFPDSIARLRYMIDIHNPDGSGTEKFHLPQGEWCELRFGVVVARDLTNLTVGGRCVSVDHAMHSSMRVMPPACTVGQAAGLAAALAAQCDVSTHDLDGVAIHNMLKDQGASLT